MPYGVPQHTSDYLRNSSGNFAMFTAISLVSPFVSNFAADRRPGSFRYVKCISCVGRHISTA